VISGLSFAAWIAREKPDALLLTSWHPLSWAVFAGRTAGVDRIIMRLGLVRPFPKTGPRRRAMQDVDAIIANSAEIRDVWDSTAPPDLRGRVTVVMNGIESLRDRRETLRQKLRSELELPDTALVIGGAGHLFERKGFDYLIRAFANADMPRSVVVIAGDGDEKSRLEKLASDLGVADRVHLLGHRKDGPELMASLDLFVLSSHNEGMANVMLEAMAGGTPVIASDISGVQHAIGNTEGRPPAGWIVPPADESALTKMLREVGTLIHAGDAEVSRRTREAAWRIEHWFGIDRMVDECERVIFAR
jgi:glycosyltransferase involved in cell wall biosynthesis